MQPPAAPEPPAAAPRRCHPLRTLLPDVRREGAALAALTGRVPLAQLLLYLSSGGSSFFCGHLGKVRLVAVLLAVSESGKFQFSLDSGGNNHLLWSVSSPGVILQRGILILLLCWFSCWAIFINTKHVLLLLKQDPGVARLAQVYMIIFIPALPVSVTVRTSLCFRGSAWANTTSQFCLAALLTLYVCWRKLHVATWGGPLGFAVSVRVRVGNAPGAGDAEQARRSCVTVTVCTGVCALVVGILVAASKDVIGYIFNRDKYCFYGHTGLGAPYFAIFADTTLLPSILNIVSLVSCVMPVFAPFHLFDAIAGACGGVLRGTGKQKAGAILNAIGYYVIGFPIGVSLMFAAELGIVGLWSGLMACVFFQAPFFLVFVLKTNWNRVAEQAQVRAGLKGIKETIPTSTELPVLEGKIADGVILPDVIRLESQSTQLMAPEEDAAFGMPAVGDVWSVAQLIFYCGMALAAAIAVPFAGILVRVFKDWG